MYTVGDLLKHMAEQRVTKRECEVCGKVFNPQDKGSYVLVCSYNCAEKKFFDQYTKESNDKDNVHQDS